MYAYVARQPILNRQRNTVGYELLFRDGESNAFPHIEANQATSRLVVENFMAVGQNPALKAPRCFINFPYESLIHLIPTMLPKNKIVVEVLETCTPDDELFSAIKHLHRMGYTIALDDFNPNPGWDRFIPYAHIVKLDLMQLGVEEACKFVDKQVAGGAKCKFLAEKVETYEDFNIAKAAGFHYFQGYFFSKPEVLKNRAVKPEQLTTLQLFQEVSKPCVDFKKVEEIIMLDVSLSYQLLRFVNTATTRLEAPISSFKQALIYLGEDKLKMFVSLVATAHAAIDKPQELYKLSLLRARFFELLTHKSNLHAVHDQAFITGLFSLLDSLLDHPIEQLIDLLPLSTEIQNALLRRQGMLGELLGLQEAYERAEWERVEHYCELLSLDGGSVKTFYTQAETWSNEFKLK
ncbi:HDOD domain-containing protein [Vibrio sp. Of7-15]|uniref:EAL and HDOD domain-containing protein n=1 Tax=Vibrio sp. Of7-15 TaxID=2724879 RepID=UPI001EF1B81C|nr:HDOD domain-containing protein [Vibrio sp. Of7-15]MCG7498895.1 HDOD domain-containing protein [Vibrio sp. Of7-15]